MAAEKSIDASRLEGFSLIWKSMLAYGLWFILRNSFTKITFLIPFWNSFNDLIASWYIGLSAWTLGLMGHPTRFNTRNLLIEGTNGLYAGNHCLGISAGFIFVFIILLLKGTWKAKLSYISFGIVVIFLINWFRIVGLAFMLKYGSKAFFHFNHSYTYLVMVYGIIFLMIIYFLNSFSKRYFQR
jgi:exosortase/archaeosortase family protein